MNIRIMLNDLEEGGAIFTYDENFYLTGDLKGYIEGGIYVYDYHAEFLYRVTDPENGKDNIMIRFTEPPTPEQKEKVDKAFNQLEKTLTELSENCRLKEALGLDLNSDNYYDIKIDSEDGAPYLYINGDQGYSLTHWKIAEAVKEYDTPEAAEARQEAYIRAYTD